MNRIPVWHKLGWRPMGPGFCRCPRCGAKVSTNAYARTSHTCPPKQEQQK